MWTKCCLRWFTASCHLMMEHNASCRSCTTRAADGEPSGTNFCVSFLCHASPEFNCINCLIFFAELCCDLTPHTGWRCVSAGSMLIIHLLFLVPLLQHFTSLYGCTLTSISTIFLLHKQLTCNKEKHLNYSAALKNPAAQLIFELCSHV